RADAVDDERAQQEDQPALQVAELADGREGIGRQGVRSPLPGRRGLLGRFFRGELRGTHDRLDRRHASARRFDRGLRALGGGGGLHPGGSSTCLPRLAAMSEGRRCCSRPSSVARTTLYGLVEPWHLAEMLVTPITSKTARMAPPALMPLPSIAGFIITRVAPCRPITSWWIVPLLIATLTRLRRACSIAFCTATGTSRALPLPMPMEP